METWEFFLQKVGEADWLPLDTTQPELPTGWYTVAARAQHRPHELIEVELNTRETPDAIARERKRQHACQLDEQGFGILIPEIQLTPGIWEIQCGADLLDALLGEDWAITLPLRVTLDLESTSIQLQQPAATEVPTEDNSQEGEDLEALRSRFLEEADQMLEDVVAELFPTFQAPPADNSNQVAPAYSLQLDQDQLMADLSKPIIISGQVIAHESGSHPSLRLMIRLRDPRTGDLIAELFPRLPDSPFPLTFCYSLTVASSCSSYLLEGEVTLCEENLPDQAQIFDRQQFTVTAKWEKLQSLLTVTSPTKSHPCAPLSPLSAKDTLSSDVSQKWQGVLPPRLSVKRTHRNKKPYPRLPILPKSSPPPPSQEYVWSKPEAEASPAYEWELIPELVIISTDETQS